MLKILLLLDNVLHNSDEKVIFKKDLDLEANKRPIITEKIPTVPLMLFASLGLITFFLINFFIDNDKSGGKLAVIEPKSNIEIVEIKENLADKIKKIKEEIPIKQTNVNVDDIENYKILEDIFEAFMGALFEDINNRDDYEQTGYDICMEFLANQ